MRYSKPDESRDLSIRKVINRGGDSSEKGFYRTGSRTAGVAQLSTNAAEVSNQPA